MNCDLAHERIVLAAYGELPDDGAHELDRHLVGCPGCRRECEQLRAMKLLADAYPMEEPPANLVARSRLRLEEALDVLPPKRWFERLAQRLTNNVASLQAAPLAACLMLAIGAGAGGLGGYYVAQSHAARAGATASVPQRGEVVDSASAVTPAEVANISSIVRQPNSEIVEVRYNELVPRQKTGSLDDRGIRELLMLATEDGVSAGLRGDSVDLLASECRAGHECTHAGIRDVLMVALRYDRSSAVRLNALRGLEPYVAEDVQVRDAVLEALLNDGDARIREAAISVLSPVDADTSVRQVLHSVASTDRNPQIRLVSRQALSHVPEIQ